MEKKTFRLSGEEYRLSKTDVEEKLRNVAPRPLGKYRVSIGGIDYPPKQVVAESLDKNLVTFTTMDASRILSSLGFEVLRVGEKRQPQRNESELLFEQYLAMSGLFEFQFEKEFPGKAQRPDYLVELVDGTKIIFEVKEFRATAGDFRPGGGAYDPYITIREKIQQGREQFKAFKESCCCLVLFNREKPLVDLSWRFIYGAMLGNFGYRIPFDAESGTFDSGAMTQTFTTGGAMHRYHSGHPIAPQNQTISAILVMDLLPIGRMRFEDYIEEIETKRRLAGLPGLTLDEHLQLVRDSQGTERDYSLTQLRGVVHENPYARITLPRELFRGPYDERYGPKDGHLETLYVGSGILALEKTRGARLRRSSL